MSRFKIRERLVHRFVGNSASSNDIPDIDIAIPSMQLSDWRPLNDTLLESSFWQIKPDVLAALDTGDWSTCTTELAPDIFRLKIFEPVVLSSLHDELLALEQWAKSNQVDVSPPNSMHHYGIETHPLGLTEVLDNFVRRIAEAFSRAFFPEVVDSGLTSQHSFFVTYGPSHNRSLGFHADDSEVTFNFCLGGNFIGSDLYFQGRRCFEHMQTPHRYEEHIEIEQIPGTCIVHAGLHRHGVLPILQGERRSLIVWTHSESFRQREGRRMCTDWCGMNGALM